jgi:hypothetical protein
MKTFAALFLGMGLLIQGSAFADAPNGADTGAQNKTVAYDNSVAQRSDASAPKSKATPCDGAGDDCKAPGAVDGCGAFASSQEHIGFGFGATASAATSKAIEMCGQNECHVESVGCQD